MIQKRFGRIATILAFFLFVFFTILILHVRSRGKNDEPGECRDCHPKGLGEMAIFDPNPLQ